ncbi:unnamed protein product [Penicillium olsonii]|uniref:Uncharacterized protein n=1 Tax=Penicillium olsonii TaxID=99116 RepID=A0A9W4HRJ7_PENOL|nr:unnamed protein product [Penicillium olsonii]CAG8100471.1 unnamed protein product [Penicillium olsonii]CAG8254674.1 unnamed protein product [Penicillium olsonii]
MCYKTNYEPYSRGSIDSRRSPPPDELLLSPLATLYPHVAALQAQYNSSSSTFTGYQDTEYWAAAYTTQPLEQVTSRRTSDALPCRFVSKLRRLLSRDELKQRRGSRATA